jgi:hypothetical protein
MVDPFILSFYYDAIIVIIMSIKHLLNKNENGQYKSNFTPYNWVVISYFKLVKIGALFIN